MKILRAELDSTTVYIECSEGKAEVSILEWQRYCEALKVICEFETKVDKQYEKP